MKIVLRPITINDSDLLINWRNNEKVLSHCLSRAPITKESHRLFYKTCIETGRYKQFIVERIEEEFGIMAYPIATVYLKDMDYVNERCELCIFTSNDEEWISESQIIAIRMLVEKAFVEYKIHKVYTYVFYNHTEEVELFKSAGFSVESFLKEEAKEDDGTFSDLVRLCIINNK